MTNINIINCDSTCMILSNILIYSLQDQIFPLLNMKKWKNKEFYNSILEMMGLETMTVSFSSFL